ncbi:hypothetical protein [Streptomyces sp. CC53]|uniref:hypothetical protein n=1 Tax=Streptomyces sp. CC53 TaxID=1906740 RepID=UPI00115FA258|nr:hypothetical protein [Streptomyces sp. CC53]
MCSRQSSCTAVIPSSHKEISASLPTPSPSTSSNSARSPGGFTSLHDEATSLSWSPGTDALTKIAPLFRTSQRLTSDALTELSALDGSAYTAVPGSRHTLDALAAAVSAASSGTTCLAQAIAANPLDGSGFPGPPADENAIRQARNAEAIPLIAEHLADAARDFELAATCCAYIASGIADDVRAHPAHTRTPAPAPAPITSSRPARR